MMNGFGDSSDWLRVITLADYNTRVVMLGVTILGMACGVIGCFTLLRKRALVGDAASHATLPGLALAFIIMTVGGDGKSLPGLLLGAALAGLAGMGTVLAIRHATRLKEDAALGVVLSVYFGLGMALLGVIQKMRLGHAAGLESFIYGKTASMLAADAWLIAGMAAIVFLACLLLYKEFVLICFDQEYAGARGYPVRVLDASLMLLIVLAVGAGLQAVGLILMIALLIIPPAAARFWTDHLQKMIVLSAIIGAISGVTGAAISALAPRLPAGALIVLVAGSLFLMSLVFGPARGLLCRGFSLIRLRYETALQHVMRLLYEWEESSGAVGITREDLVHARSWTHSLIRRTVRQARKRGWIMLAEGERIRLTDAGRRKAMRVVRNHRLWEAYLIHYAQVAAHHVDRNADRIEHVLDPETIEHLEAVLADETRGTIMPPSPHPLDLHVSDRGRNGQGQRGAP